MNATALALLPLTLVDTPPGLELILRQEGVPFVLGGEGRRDPLGPGRFVLHDRRRPSGARRQPWLLPGQVAIDIDRLRRGEPIDPFAELVDDRAARKVWRVDGMDVSERVSRYDKGAIRERLIGRLRDAVESHGGVWARLARFPHPYRSVFNFRADLDEPYPDDLAAFAEATRPIADCTTLFLSTAAYGDDPASLRLAARYDVQSHGHHHVVYRDGEANERNLRRADQVLRLHGIRPEGFAAPEGRWNPGLDDVLEGLGYRYSSDFHLGYDDLPFFPWRGDRFSTVLQVPVHPVCEGIVLDAGERDLARFGEHLRRTARCKIEAGEPAFLYGHPERRLGRHPGALRPLIEEIQATAGIWRVTLTEFARWWRWRSDRRWSLHQVDGGDLCIRCDLGDARHPLAVELFRAGEIGRVPVERPETDVALPSVRFMNVPPGAERLREVGRDTPRGIKHLVKAALDWETVTPIGELPTRTLGQRLKRDLRKLRARRIRGAA